MSQWEIQDRYNRIEVLREKNAQLRYRISSMQDLISDAHAKRAQLADVQSQLTTLAGCVCDCKSNSSLLRQMASEIQELVYGGFAANAQDSIDSSSGRAQQEIYQAEDEIRWNDTEIGRLEDEIREISAMEGEGMS